MKNQGTFVTVRRVVLGAAIVGLAGVLGGCTLGGVKGGPGMMAKPSNISFEVTPDANDRVLLVVDPDDGDASLEAVKNPNAGDNKITWHANFPFGVKFVQIDDPTKKPKKKFGPNQKDDWNPATCNSSNTSCTLPLDLDPGTDAGKGKKEIRAAKYIVAAPSGCNEATPIPADCRWQDPVIIVRY